MLITLEEAKTYLRVDSVLEEPLILSLLPAAEKTGGDRRTGLREQKQGS